jgi:hypothetical protein
VAAAGGALPSPGRRRAGGVVAGPVVNHALFTSALFEISFAVLLGWPLNSFRSGKKRVGPFHSMRRLLQAHLDYIFMSMLQMGVAANHPAIPPAAGYLLIVGSWVNPTLFLLGGILSAEQQNTKASAAVTAASFASLTVAYPWLLWAWMNR